jgi:hypothetical protein
VDSGIVIREFINQGSSSVLFGTWVELGFPLGAGRVPSSWQRISYYGRVEVARRGIVMGTS